MTNYQVKATRAEIKKTEKDLMALRLLASRDCAEATVQDKPDGLADEGKAVQLFEILDRASCGTVNKRDFIFGLANDEVSSFFKLPCKIHQEDGSRDLMEKVFQEIAGNETEFDLSALISYVDRQAA